jgi:hypothetical protein
LHERQLSSATTTTVDSPDDVGLGTAATIGADGLPLVVYSNDTVQELKVAHCSNVFCVPHFRRR